MERHDDAEQHQDARGDTPGEGDYPRGRGYGQDYMRGGEVFGGYGYSERPDYALPLAEQQRQQRAAGQAAGEPGNDAPPEDDRQFVRELKAIEGEPEPVPPSEFSDTAREPSGPPTDRNQLTPDLPPVPQVEGSFGTEGPLNYSRSYYVTQAQLQQRLYQPPSERQAPGLPVDIEE